MTAGVMSARTGTFPDGIDEDHVQPIAGWRRHASPLSLAVFGAVVALALSGWLGHERTWRAEGDSATLEVHAPEIIRNGEFLEMRIRVSSELPIAELAIGVDETLWEDITVNTLIPAASQETNRDGETRFTFTDLAAGTAFLFKVDAQINPDIVLGNDGVITLYDGDAELAAVELAIMVLP
jgi:hypothetical protein